MNIRAVGAELLHADGRTDKTRRSQYSLFTILRTRLKTSVSTKVDLDGFPCSPTFAGQCPCKNINHLSRSHHLTCNTIQRNRQCLFTYQVQTCCCVPATRIYLTSRQVTFTNHQYYSVRLTRHTSHGNAITMTRQTSGVCIQAQIFAK